MWLLGNVEKDDAHTCCVLDPPRQGITSTLTPQHDLGQSPAASVICERQSADIVIITSENGHRVTRAVTSATSPQHQVCSSWGRGTKERRTYPAVCGHRDMPIVFAPCLWRKKGGRTSRCSLRALTLTDIYVERFGTGIVEKVC